MSRQNNVCAVSLYVVQDSPFSVAPYKASSPSSQIRHLGVIAYKQTHSHRITLVYHSQRTMFLHLVVSRVLRRLCLLRCTDRRRLSLRHISEARILQLLEVCEISRLAREGWRTLVRRRVYRLLLRSSMAPDIMHTAVLVRP
jgi:hypothetical protein